MSIVPFFRLALRDAEIAAVIDTLRSGWVASGPAVRQFEEAAADAVGAPAALAVCSGTAALYLGLAAAGVGPGDEVITPAMTCAATVNAIEHAGATPVFADVDPVTLTVDVEDVARAVTAATRAVVPVHYAGHPYDVDGLTALARRHGFAVVDDAAHAIGARTGDRPVGSLADGTAFSFHATKLMTTGEGGMLVGPEDIVRRARILATHGLEGEHRRVVQPGLKLLMSDLQASLGRQQLVRLPELLTRRRLIAERYLDALADVPGLALPVATGDVEPVWHLFTVRVGTGRDAFLAELARRGIQAAPQFRPVHLEPYYRRRYPAVSLPHTERESARVLSLPLYPDLTDEEVTSVIDAVHAAALHLAPTDRS